MAPNYMATENAFAQERALYKTGPVYACLSLNSSDTLSIKSAPERLYSCQGDVLSGYAIWSGSFVSISSFATLAADFSPSDTAVLFKHIIQLPAHGPPIAPSPGILGDAVIQAQERFKKSSTAQDVPKLDAIFQDGVRMAHDRALQETQGISASIKMMRSASFSIEAELRLLQNLAENHNDTSTPLLNVQWAAFHKVRHVFLQGPLDVYENRLTY